MNQSAALPRYLGPVLTAWLLLALSACGGGGDGAAIRAQAQSIHVVTSPVSTLTLSGSTRLQTNASSGMPVTYSSITPAICSVDAHSGEITALKVGNCQILAAQSGDEAYAPARTLTLSIDVQADRSQAITIDEPAQLSLGGTTTVRATASSGLPVNYLSLTPSICSVDPNQGQVEALTLGDCIIAANQPGSTDINPAAQVTKTLSVLIPTGMSVPGQAQGVTASAGDTMRTVVVKAASVDSGGSAITRYTVASLPAGISIDSTTLPATISCPASCAGYSFTITAHNIVGQGPVSSAAHVITRYNVITTFKEPDTQPRNSVFKGSFVFDATTGTVSQLSGTLSESMTGDTNPAYQPDYRMTQLALTHQLSAVRDAGLGGVLVTTFLNTNTNTFSTVVGGDGWSPAAGVDAGGLYYGYPTRTTGIANPGNAYTMIFVNTTDPTTPLSQAQLDKLAYADCAPGGMMGASCMTGSSVAGYGAVGTMSGYPFDQVITKTSD